MENRATCARYVASGSRLNRAQSCTGNLTTTHVRSSSVGMAPTEAPVASHQAGVVSPQPRQ